MINDLKFALRQLAKAPGFTAIIVLTLALGIGACTVVFSVLDYVVLRPPDYPEPERIVAINETLTGQLLTGTRARVSAADFLDWHREARSFAAMGVRSGRMAAYNGGNESHSLMALLVSAEMPRIWRDSLRVGRSILPEDYLPGKDRVVVLSHGFWQRMLGGAADIVGRSIQLDGEPWTVIGVASEQWSRINSEIEMILPIAFRETASGTNDFIDRRYNRALTCLARLKPGVTLAEAQAEMDVITARLAREYPETNSGHGVNVQPRPNAAGDTLRATLLTLLAAVGCVLLVGCANVANLLLVRATARHREFSVRAAMGASRAQLLRLVLTESLVLALLGGLAGVLLAFWGLDLVHAITPEQAGAQVHLARIDGGILTFSLVLCVTTGLLFGLSPALLSARVNLNTALKQGTRGSTNAGPNARIRGALMIFQVACVVVLLGGAGLFVRSFVLLMQVDPGFETERVTELRINLSKTKYSTNEQIAAFMDALLERVRAIPEVQIAAGTTRAPFGGAHGMYQFAIDGRAPVPNSQLPTTMIYSVTPDFFRAAGIRLLRGRTFTDFDNQPRARPVSIVNETLVKQQFLNDDPLGQRIKIRSGQWSEIIGIVADFREDELTQEVCSQHYSPFAQWPWACGMLVRHTGNPGAIHAALKQCVQALDRTQPITRIAILAERVNQTLWRQRLGMQLLTAFSLVALVIAAIGIYGVISYSVSQRTAEIGIRMALGANQSDVLWQVLRRGMSAVVVGLAIGLVATVGVGRLVQTLLFNTSPHDPLTLGAIALVLLAVAALACWLPARRAAKVDPMTALRAE